MSNDEIAADLGGRDAEPTRPGVPGRAVVLALTPSPRRLAGTGGLSSVTRERVHTLRLEVRLDDLPRFEATVVADLPPSAGIKPGESVLAVWVDPDDHQQVVVDFAAEPPDVRVVAEPDQLHAADIVAAGEPCEVVVGQATRLGLRSPDDVDLYALALTVLHGSAQAYRVRVGMPVPPAAVPLLYPGSRLPGRRLPDGRREDVAVDWSVALGVSAGAGAVAVSEALTVGWEAVGRCASPGEDQALSG